MSHLNQTPFSSQFFNSTTTKMKTSREVIITHYINPNSFWIKFDEKNEKLDDFDQQIQRAVTTKLATLLSCKFQPVVKMVRP